MNIPGTPGQLLNDLRTAEHLGVTRPWGEVELTDADRTGGHMVIVQMKEPPRSVWAQLLTDFCRTWRNTFKYLEPLLMMVIGAVALFITAAVVGGVAFTWWPCAFVLGGLGAAGLHAICVGERAEFHTPLSVAYRVEPDSEGSLRPVSDSNQAIEEILQELDEMDSEKLAASQYLLTQRKNYDAMLAVLSPASRSEGRGSES